jgi:hypothetical protein
MVIKRIYTAGTNTIWLESTTPVKMPCGTDYVTMMVIHPNDDTLSGLYVGQKFTRKQAMFTEGMDGATANHFHISVGTGGNKTARTNGFLSLPVRLLNQKMLFILTTHLPQM